MSVITIISGEETFNNLSSFSTVPELNEAVIQHIKHNKQSLNKNAVRILRHLRDYSKKYKGVSFRTKSNIAKDLKLSRRTVIRNCNLLEQLNIIKQFEMKRNSDFMQTSNAIVIQPFVSKLSENVTPVSHQKENLLKKNKTLIIKKRMETLDYTYTMEYVPKQFRDLVKYFFNDAKVIEEFWHMVMITAYRKNREQEHDTVLDYSIDAFKQMIAKLKKGRVGNKFAYFTGILKQKFDNLYYAELRQMEEELGFKQADTSKLAYNWLDN